MNEQLHEKSFLEVAQEIIARPSSEDPRTWQERFDQDIVPNANLLALSDIWAKLLEADKKGKKDKSSDAPLDKLTEEESKDLKHMIDYSGLDEFYVKHLNRKWKMLNNRVERTLNNTFGSALRTFREAKGYSLKDLGNKTGVSTSYIQRIESGERNSPSFPVIERFAEALDCTPDDLLGRSTPAGNKTVYSLEQLIASANFTIFQKKVTKEVKDTLIDLVAGIQNAVLKPGNAVKENNQMLDLINQYKEALVKLR